MRIAVLSGLFACATIFALTSAKAGASAPKPDEILENQKPETSVVEILAEVGKEKEKPEKKKPEAKKKVVHTVVKNESLSDIAKEYKTTWKRLFDKNKVVKNPDELVAGLKIVVPNDDEELKPRKLPKKPQPVVASVAPAPAASTPAPARSTSQASPQTSTRVKSTYTAPRGSSSGNLYAPGNCTWYVKSRKPSLPNNLGNAYAWVSNARRQGMATGSTPRVGAAAQRNNHVAIVEKVHGDGTITISDMNYRALYAVTTRRVPANQWTYIY